MNHAKIIAGIALATLLLSGCSTTSSSGSASTATQESYDAVVVAAKSSIKIAKSANYEWRDSSKILKKADKAAKSGDFEKATKLANKAKRQGELALAQSKTEANAGPH